MILRRCETNVITRERESKWVHVFTFMKWGYGSLCFITDVVFMGFHQATLSLPHFLNNVNNSEKT